MEITPRESVVVKLQTLSNLFVLGKETAFAQTMKEIEKSNPNTSRLCLLGTSTNCKLRHKESEPMATNPSSLFCNVFDAHDIKWSAWMSQVHCLHFQ